MTPAQYRAAIAALGLTQAGAAEFLGVSLRTSHGYANGQPIPKAIGLLLALQADDAELLASMRLGKLD